MGTRYSLAWPLHLPSREVISPAPRGVVPTLPTPLRPANNMSADEKYYDEKHVGAGTPPYNEKEDVVVSAVPVEEEDLETTHVGDHHLRRDLVSPRHRGEEC